MKTVTYTRRAARALRRLPTNIRARISRKVGQYADAPEELANNVTQLRGIDAKRLRIGDWRVILAETETVVTVLDIGPRGSVYGRQEEGMNSRRQRGDGEVVTLAAATYRELVEKAALADDAAAAAHALAALAAGREERLSVAELDELLAAPTPLAFWRRKRGLTQKALAAAADTTQSHVSALEGGANMSLVVATRLAAALAVDIDDLVA